MSKTKYSLEQLENELKRELTDLLDALRNSVSLIGQHPEVTESLYAQVCSHLGEYTTRILRTAYRCGVRSVQQLPPSPN